MQVRDRLFGQIANDLLLWLNIMRIATVLSVLAVAAQVLDTPLPFPLHGLGDEVLSSESSDKVRSRGLHIQVLKTEQINTKSC